MKSAKYKEAEKRLGKVYRSAPSSVQVNFLYGYLFLQLNDLAKAEGFLGRAAALDPRRVQTLALLGRVQLQREEDDQAQKTLEQAVADDSNHWITHYLLADTYLRHKEYERAREQAQFAIDEGKAAGNVAQLILGQALVNLGHDREGIQALTPFLQTNPNNPVAPAVRDLITKLEEVIRMKAEQQNRSPNLISRLTHPRRLYLRVPGVLPGLMTPSHRFSPESRVPTSRSWTATVTG